MNNYIPNHPSVSHQRRLTTHIGHPPTTHFGQTNISNNTTSNNNALVQKNISPNRQSNIVKSVILSNHSRNPTALSTKSNNSSIATKSTTLPQSSSLITNNKKLIPPPSKNVSSTKSTILCGKQQQPGDISSSSSYHHMSTLSSRTTPTVLVSAPGAMLHSPNHHHHQQQQHYQSNRSNYSSSITNSSTGTISSFVNSSQNNTKSSQNKRKTQQLISLANKLAPNSGATANQCASPNLKKPSVKGTDSAIQHSQSAAILTTINNSQKSSSTNNWPLRNNGVRIYNKNQNGINKVNSSSSNISSPRQDISLKQNGESRLNSPQNQILRTQVEANRQLTAQNEPLTEADEFSFTGEHIEDEPSIHIKSLSEFQSIQRGGSHSIAAKKPYEYQPQNNIIESKQEPLELRQNQKQVTQRNQQQNFNPNNQQLFETFQNINQPQSNMFNHQTSPVVVNNKLSANNINQVKTVVQVSKDLNQIANDSENQQPQVVQDDTMQEPSEFFNENDCQTSLLHRCHLIENYQVPQKPIHAPPPSKKQEECNQMLSSLITKVKQDVNQSILLNSSKNQIFKAQLNNSNSRILPKQNNITDMTSESVFLNITQEDLHNNLQKYTNIHNPIVNKVQAVAGDINESSQFNNTTFVMGATGNASVSQTMHHFNNQSVNTTNNNNNNNNQTAPQQGQSTDLHKLHLLQTLQSLQYIKQVEVPTEAEVSLKYINLPSPRYPSQQKKTIIFDLDETLIHCVDDIESEVPDQILNVNFPNGEIVRAGINVRPYAIECLKEANKNYQVVVFTASHKFYADVVLDYLDPTGELIHYRLYRDHCFQTEDGVYVKDLRIIKNRSLKDLVIVDNAVYSFGFQLENGVPIIPFYNNKDDEELLHLINYISTLAHFEDLREQNAKAFQLRELENADITDYLEYFFGDYIQQLNQQNNSQMMSYNEFSGAGNHSAIKEEDNESEQTQRYDQNSHDSQNNQTSSDEMERHHDQSSELDQDEIMKLKKRLDFIENSNLSATPNQAATCDAFSSISTPLMVNNSLFSNETNKENNQNIVVTKTAVSLNSKNSKNSQYSTNINRKSINNVARTSHDFNNPQIIRSKNGNRQ